MLTFLTLLIGIVWGPREIELDAPARTSSVEILLDGERVARRIGPPWTFIVDLGPAPEPHYLDAVARDARGAEVGRARQKLNLPRPEIEAALALLPGTGGKGRAARLVWEGAVGPVASRATASFDGAPIPAPDPARIELPTFVPGRLHFLRASVEFGMGPGAEAEITFGGRARDETSSELTAVAVRVPRGKLPPPSAMGGWLADGREPLRVAAVEDGDASILFVIDADAQGIFSRMARGALFNTRVGTFKGDPEIRTLAAYPERRPGARTSYDVYPRSFPAPIVRGMMAILAEAFTPWDGLSCPRYADAVFAAGLRASAWSHPRAVVLVLTGNPDESVLPRLRAVIPR